MQLKMFRFKIALLCLLLPLLSLAQNRGQQLFAKGNAYYAKARYPEAVDAYEQVLHAGYRSAAVYFNLGNAYYKMDDIPAAILYYEKARKLRPGDEDIRVNLQMANLRTADKIAAAPVFFMENWWNGLLLACSQQTWAIASIAGVLVGSLLLILYLFTRAYKLKRITFYTGLSFVVLGLVALFLAAMQTAYFRRHREAVVFAGAANVKSAPGDQQKTLFVVHGGTKVELGEQTDGWVRIALPNGNVGWVEAENIKEI